MKQYIFAFIALLIISCSGSKKTAETYVAEPIEYRELDTLVVTDTPVSTEEADSIDNSLPVYRASYERTIDIRHTTLDLRFDWEKESVIGKADITFKPYFYEVDSFELDAKGFEIGSVVCGDSKENIDFSYDGEKLLVHLPHSLQQDQERTISINYIAKSEEHTSELQSRGHLVCRLLLEKKKINNHDDFRSNLNNSIQLKHRSVQPP